MNTVWRRLILLALVAIANSKFVVGFAAEPAVRTQTAVTALPNDRARLRSAVVAADRQMFDAYNAHDVDLLMSMFSQDVEFYHDTGGALNFDQVKSGFTNVFANNPDIRRQLVPGSLEVYPIKDFGAIQIGAHRFCHTERNKLDCGTFRFLQVWRFADGAWRVTRVVSYGHVTPRTAG